MTTYGYFRTEECRLADLVHLLEVGASDDLLAYPNADRSEQGVLVYEARTVRAAAGDDRLRALRDNAHSQIPPSGSRPQMPTSC